MQFLICEDKLPDNLAFSGDFINYPIPSNQHISIGKPVSIAKRCNKTTVYAEIRRKFPDHLTRIGVEFYDSRGLVMICYK